MTPKYFSTMRLKYFSDNYKYFSPCRFYDFPELTFEQVNRSPGSQPLAVHNGSVSLALAEGVMHDVLVSSIVGGGEKYFLNLASLVGSYHAFATLHYMSTSCCTTADPYFFI